MNYKKLIAVTIAFTVCALAGSNVTAHGGGGGHGGFSGGAFGRAGFNGGGFAVALTAVAFVAVSFVAVAFVMVAFAAIGSTIATSTIGSSSLAISGTRSFTIPIHTTGTIPIAIILTVTDTVLTINLFTRAAADIPTL